MISITLQVKYFQNQARQGFAIDLKSGLKFIFHRLKILQLIVRPSVPFYVILYILKVQKNGYALYIFFGDFHSFPRGWLQYSEHQGNNYSL